MRRSKLPAHVPVVMAATPLFQAQSAREGRLGIGCGDYRMPRLGSANWCDATQGRRTLACAVHGNDYNPKSPPRPLSTSQLEPRVVGPGGAETEMMLAVAIRSCSASPADGVVPAAKDSPHERRRKGSQVTAYGGPSSRRDCQEDRSDIPAASHQNCAGCLVTLFAMISPDEGSGNGVDHAP